MLRPAADGPYSFTPRATRCRMHASVALTASYAGSKKVSHGASSAATKQVGADRISIWVANICPSRRGAAQQKTSRGRIRETALRRNTLKTL